MRCFRGERTSFTAVEWASSRWIKSEAYLVELIAEVYGVDVVTLEIREHYDLSGVV